MSIKVPLEPMTCPECGGPEVQSGMTREHYHQTPGLSVPALHTRRQRWECGHESFQWWFQRTIYEGIDMTEILAAGVGKPSYVCYSDYKKAHV